MISFSVLHKMRPMMILNIYLLSLSTQDVYILSNFEHKPTVQLRPTSLEILEVVKENVVRSGIFIINS